MKPMVAKEVATMMDFCLFLWWKKKILTKLLKATKAIRNSSTTLSRTEKTLMLPSAAFPAKVGTNQVIPAHVALSSSHNV